MALIAAASIIDINALLAKEGASEETCRNVGKCVKMACLETENEMAKQLHEASNKTSLAQDRTVAAMQDNLQQSQKMEDKQQERDMYKDKYLDEKRKREEVENAYTKKSEEHDTILEENKKQKTTIALFKATYSVARKHAAKGQKMSEDERNAFFDIDETIENKRFKLKIWFNKWSGAGVAKLRECHYLDMAHFVTGKSSDTLKAELRHEGISEKDHMHKIHDKMVDMLKTSV